MSNLHIFFIVVLSLVLLVLDYFVIVTSNLMIFAKTISMVMALCDAYRAKKVIDDEKYSFSRAWFRKQYKFRS